MNKLSKLAALAAIVILQIPAFSQELKTGYFVDNYMYGSSLNPALQPGCTNAYVGALVNNVTLGASSDIGVSSLFFPYDGELVTGLNKNISADTFLGGLNVSNNVNVDLSENIFVMGFRSGKGKAFNTISVNLKSTSALSVPKSVFEFLKVGGNEDVYDIDNVSLNTKNYLEFSYGYSRRLSDMVTVGAAVKALVGVAYVGMNVDRLTLDTSGDEVVASGTGSLAGSIPAYDFETYDNGCYDFSEVIETKKYINGNFGLAMDLGVVVTPFEGLSVSAAVTDLGFIKWNTTIAGTMGGTTTFSLAENEDVQDNLQDMFMFRKTDTGSKVKDALNAQANIGARYQLPFSRMLSVGALCSFRLGDTYYKYTDCRAGITFTPGRVFSMAASAGYGTYGFSAGGALNLRLAVVNLFAGIDGIFTKINAQYVPVNPVNTVAKVGLTFYIGEKKNNK